MVATRKPEPIWFPSSAADSASELEYPLLLAHDLECLPRDAHAELDEQVAEVKRMPYRFLPSLRSTDGWLTAPRRPIPCWVPASPGGECRFRKL